MNISEKYGFLHLNDNWHEEHFQVWQSLIDEKYQKCAAMRQKVTDWEAYFSRSVDEFKSEKGDMDKYLEFALIELIKQSQHIRVVADIYAPIPLIGEIFEYNRVACLLAPAERGENVNKFFAIGEMKAPVKPKIQRVNVDFTLPMLLELDEYANILNISRQAVIRTL